MYRKESRKILSVFQEICPIVEKASIDESFLDLTALVRTQLLERYPPLRSVPADAPLGLDTPLPLPHELGIDRIEWDELGNLVPFNGQKKDKLKRLDSNRMEVPPSSSPAKPAPEASNAAPCTDGDDSPDQVDAGNEDDDCEPPLTWSDLALSIGASIVSKVRSETHQRLGYTCSAGIAPNKMLAKLCSAWKKPNAQVSFCPSPESLTVAEIDTFLAHARVPDHLATLCSVGLPQADAVPENPEPWRQTWQRGQGDLRGRDGRRPSVRCIPRSLLARNLIDERLRASRKYTLAELQAKLGDDSGVWLWEVCRGLDFTEGAHVTLRATGLSCH